MDPQVLKGKESKGGSEPSPKSGKNATAKESSSKEGAGAKKSSSSVAEQPVQPPAAVGSAKVSPASSSSRIPASHSSRATVGGSPAASEVVVDIPETEQRIPKKTMLLLIVTVAVIGFVLLFIIGTVIFARKGHKAPTQAGQHHTRHPPSGTDDSSLVKTTRKPTQPKLPVTVSVLVSSPKVAEPDAMNSTATGAMNVSVLVTIVSPSSIPGNVSLGEEMSTEEATWAHVNEPLQTDKTEENDTTHAGGDATMHDNNPKSNATDDASEVSVLASTPDEKFSNTSEGNLSGHSDLITSAESAADTESQASDAHTETTIHIEDANASSAQEIPDVTPLLTPSANDTEGQASDASRTTTNDVEDADVSSTREIPEVATALSQSVNDSESLASDADKETPNGVEDDTKDARVASPEITAASTEEASISS